MESGSNINLEAATTALTNMKDALGDWVIVVAPILIALVGGFLLFYLIRYVVRLVRETFVYK